MITVTDIQVAVAAEWRVNLSDIISRRRGEREVLPRLAAYLIARNLTPCSLPQIGRRFGRDHTTVLDGIRSCERKMANHPAYAEKVKAVERRLRVHG